MKNSNIFTQHPDEVGMTYFGHLRFALMLSRRTAGCALASLIHAFLPFLFVTHTSRTVREIQDIFDERFDRLNDNSTTTIP